MKDKRQQLDQRFAVGMQKAIISRSAEARYAPQRITGFHRIRYYGLIANTARKDNLARAREILMSEKTDEPTDAQMHGADTVDGCDDSATYVCPDCGAPMRVIDIFLRGQLPRAPPRCIAES